jgi:hypothetical protein
VLVKRPDEVTWTAEAWRTASFWHTTPAAQQTAACRHSTMPMTEMRPPSDSEMPAMRTWTSCEAPDYRISEHQAAPLTVTFCS